MASLPDDLDSRRLHHELDQAIKLVNREQISTLIGPISRSAFKHVAEVVACLRARYLKAVLDLELEDHAGCVPTEVALGLKPLREAYTETMEGFAALEQALKRGYVELSD